MIEAMVAAALAQAAPASPAPDPCNAAGRAAQPLAGCPTWELFHSNGEGKDYVDPASARRDGSAVEVTIRVLLSTPFQSAHSLHSRSRLDCAARTVRQLHVTGFDAEGRLVVDGPARGVQPIFMESGTPYGGLLDRFCPR